MATEEKPAETPETEPVVETLSEGKLVYRVSEPELMRFREAAEGETAVIEGRMVPYDEWAVIQSKSENGGQPFKERFAPGSVAKTLRERGHRIRTLFEHGFDILGLQPIATFDDFRDEDDGAWYEASLFRSVPELIVEGLRRNVYGASIRFRPMPGKLEVVRPRQPTEDNPDRLPEHTIREAFIKEFSIVTFPAYEGATASIRSFTDEIRTRHDTELLKDPERLIELIRAVTHEPQHSEPEKPAPEGDGDGSEGSRSTRPTHDYLSTEKGAPTWRL